jgi:hypothetical protein
MAFPHHPSALPHIQPLIRLSQSLALLDALFMPEWQYRYYSFNAHWNDAEMMASMRNGEGDDYFIWFAQPGAVLKGFAHESAVWAVLSEQRNLTLSSLSEQIPTAFEPFLREPAFSIEETTFCLWRQLLDPDWAKWQLPVPKEVASDDGLTELLALLDGNPNTYQHWADEYYGQRPPLDAIQEIYDHKPLTEALLMQLGCSRKLDELAEELEEIGYPSPASQSAE